MRPHIPLADLNSQHAGIEAELRQALDAVLEHGRFVAGPEVGQFEAEFAAYCETEHCVGVSSGTDALTVGLMAAGIGAGDEVIVPSLTFFATAEAVAQAGAEPVVVDVDLDDGLMSVEHAEAALTPRTAAIMPVHLYGQTVDLSAFRTLADKHGLLLVEDAAQAHGATWRGRRAGSVGAFGAFSFFPGKNLGALGDAGAITTNDAAIADTARSLRDHGRSGKYVHEAFGVNARLDTIQAAALRVKLRHLDRWNELRRQHAATYLEAFAGHPSVRPLRIHEQATPVFHQFVVRSQARADLISALEQRGIATGLHYPVPLHRQAPLAASVSAPALPNAETLSDEVVSLPIYPELSIEDREAVVRAIEAIDEPVPASEVRAL